MLLDVTVLSAIGIGPDERRWVLGVSCTLSEAEVHWRTFSESQLKRGMSGVRFVVSDDHSGLKARRGRPCLRGCVATLPVPYGAEYLSPYAQPENLQTHLC